MTRWPTPAGTPKTCANALRRFRRHTRLSLTSRGEYYACSLSNRNQLSQYQLATLPGAQIPAVDLTGDRRHGRIESRSLELVALAAGIRYPHTRLATPAHPPTTIADQPPVADRLGAIDQRQGGMERRRTDTRTNFGSLVCSSRSGLLRVEVVKVDLVDGAEHF
jgi:hypothetical protein